MTPSDRKLIEDMCDGRCAAVPVLLDLHEAVTRWREAVCTRPARLLVGTGVPGVPNMPACFGDNHVETCPVELAREDIIAIHNKGLP